MKCTLLRLLPGLPLALAFGAPAVAQTSDAVNDVTGVSVEETAEQTIIRIQGDANPTYSVYRLRNPLRLFVDISNSALVGDPTTVSVGNGVVGQVGVVEYEDSLAQVTRVVVGFDADAHYDVTNDGNDLIVTIDGARRLPFVAGGPTSADEFAALQVELEASRNRQEALEGALADAQARASDAEANVIREQIARERAEAERLAAIAGEGTAEGRADALAGESERLRAELASRDVLLTEMLTRQAELEQVVVSLEAAGVQGAELEAAVAARDAQIVEMQTQQMELQSVIQQSRENEADLQRALVAAQTVEVPAPAPQVVESELLLEQMTVATSAPESTTSVEELRELWGTSAAPAPSVTPVVALPIDASISDVRFEQVDGVDRVVVNVADGVDFDTLPWENGRAALVFSGATLPDSLRRTLDTQAFAGPVAFVSSYTDGDGNVRVVAELQDAASEIVRREGDAIVWEFTGSTEEAAPMQEVASASNPTTTVGYAGQWNSYDQADSYDAGSVGMNSPFQVTPRMTDKRITIDLRNADIQNVLRLIADEGNINIVASDEVNGSITLRLRSVPLDDALALILRSKGLGWQQTGNLLRVAPLATFEDEYDRELQRLADQFGLEPLSVRLIPVNYAEVDDVAGVVADVLSARGSVATDSRTNTLVVTDILGHLDTAEALVNQLDTQTPQILIEARIVETNDQFRRQLGIQWGGDFIADQSLGNSTGLLFPSTIGIGGGATDGQAPNAGTSSSPSYAVNLPAPAGTGTGGAIGFTFGNLSGSFNLNVRLSAAETEGTAKVVSAPRIVTLDNEEASITSGVSIPVAVVSAAGAQTVFFDAALTLQVKPRVTPDGNIFLEVQITKNEPDFENTGSRGDPSIIRREARTQLLVRDGDTSVIGGIFQRNTGFSVDRVPFFGSLPVIGPLFRNSSHTDVRNELLVFITPRIVNRDLSIDQIGAGGDIMRVEDEE